MLLVLQVRNPNACCFLQLLDPPAGITAFESRRVHTWYQLIRQIISEASEVLPPCE